MRILIIEDEKPASQKLLRMLGDIEKGYEIISVLESVEDSINWLSRNTTPDLIFMDIQLSDGLCFEIFESVEINTPIIFTTAYNEYMLNAFKVNSVDYLLKPFDQESLQKAINKFNTFHRSADYVKLVELLNHQNSLRKERFLVKVGEHFKSIQTLDISCFYIKERCNFIFTASAKNYSIDYSLDRVEGMIDPRRFFRVNRNMIINLSSIKDVIAYSSNRLKIVINDWPVNEEVLVSRERVADFKIWLDQ